MPYNPNAPLSVSVSGPNIQSGSTQERQNIVENPFTAFLKQQLANFVSNRTGEVPTFTKDALQAFTANPAAGAATFFPQLAAPLLASLRPSEERETKDLTDLFRKAGGTTGEAINSGAFATSARQLINDQGSRRNQLLAQEYNPLTQQISTNINNAIRAGLDFPEATAAQFRYPVALAGVNPIQQSDTERLTAGTSASANAQSAAPLTSGISPLNPFWSGNPLAPLLGNNYNAQPYRVGSTGGSGPGTEFFSDGSVRYT